jgi:hypothetical protein
MGIGGMIDKIKGDRGLQAYNKMTIRLAYNHDLSAYLLIAQVVTEISGRTMRAT